MTKGLYFDGKSARQQEVDVRLTGQFVEFTDGTGRLDESWPMTELWTPERKVAAGRPVTLACHDREDARLTIEDLTFADALLGQAPNLGRGMLAGPERGKQVAIVFALLLFCLAGGAAILHFYAAPMARVIPVAWVAPLGDQAFGLLVGKNRLCKSDDADRIIRQMAGKFAHTLGQMPPVEILIADTKTVNAFALPGGRIIFMRGIIDKMDNPNEFAAVLAHEMAHVAERHPTVAYIRVMGFRAILSIITSGTGVFENIGEVGSLLAMLSYSRKYEADADRLAFKQLAAQEIDPRGLANLFRKMQKQKKEKRKMEKRKNKQATKKENNISIDIIDYFSTHPAITERIATAEAEFARNGHTGAGLNDTDWQAIKRVCG